VLGSEHKEKLSLSGRMSMEKGALNQELGGSYKLKICVIKIINNLLNSYDNYAGKYKILLNFFNKVTSQIKD